MENIKTIITEAAADNRKVTEYDLLVAGVSGSQIKQAISCGLIVVLRTGEIVLG